MNHNQAAPRVNLDEFTVGGGFLRRGRNTLLGYVAILAGLIIILSLVLPSAFWWFILAALLICFGFWYIRCC